MIGDSKTLKVYRKYSTTKSSCRKIESFYFGKKRTFDRYNWKPWKWNNELIQFIYSIGVNKGKDNSGRCPYISVIILLLIIWFILQRINNQQPLHSESGNKCHEALLCFDTQKQVRVWSEKTKERQKATNCLKQKRVCKNPQFSG